MPSILSPLAVVFEIWPMDNRQSPIVDVLSCTYVCKLTGARFLPSTEVIDIFDILIDGQLTILKASVVLSRSQRTMHSEWQR